MESVNLHNLKAGLLNERLAINNPVLIDDERRQAKHKLQQLKDIMNPKRPHCLAIKNMIAVLHYRLGEEQEATDLLEDILKEDPYNLNVLQDLCHIYQQNYRNKDKMECEKRLKIEMDKLDTEEISENGLIFARCIAGKGFAWGFDVHPESKEAGRLDASLASYEQALIVCGDRIDIKEREDWLYYLALVYIRLNNIKRVSQDRVLYLEVFDKILKCLKPNMVSDDQERRSASWCLLGTLFAQKPYNATAVPKSIKNTELKAFWFRPEKCYLRASEMNGRNWEALNQLAHLYYKQRKLDEALGLLDKSLEIYTATSNTYALHIRGQIHLNIFNSQLQKKLQKKGPPPDRKHLHEAKTDLLSCVQSNPYVLDMIHLAEIHHKLAWNEDTSRYENKGLNEALRWCTRAENCQDGAIRPDLHQRRALILQDLGDIDDTIKCFMQAVDCEQPGSSSNRNFVFMMKAMLKRYHCAETKPKYMVHELVYWMVQGVKKYPNCKLGSFVTGYPEEMLDVGELMFKSGRQKQIELAGKIVKAFKDKQVDSARLAVLEQHMKEFLSTLTTGESKASTKSKALKKANAAGLKLCTSTEKVTTCVLSSSHPPPGPNGGNSPEKETAVMAVAAHVESSGAGLPFPNPISASPNLRSLNSGEHSKGSSANYRQSFQMVESINTEDIQGGAIIHSKSPTSSSHHEGNNQYESKQNRDRPELNKGATKECIDGHNCSPPVKSLDIEGSTDMTKEEDSFQGRSDEGPTDKMLTTSVQIGVPPYKAIHSGLKYDFLVVFDTESAKLRDWVHYHLRSQLEEGRDALKGCILERDFELNTSSMKNVTSAIEGSAKVLLVISDGFLESNFCKEGLQVILQHDHKLILIIMDNISLPSYMEAFTRVEATNAINWKRLYKFISQ